MNNNNRFRSFETLKRGPLLAASRYLSQIVVENPIKKERGNIYSADTDLSVLFSSVSGSRVMFTGGGVFTSSHI